MNVSQLAISDADKETAIWKIINHQNLNANLFYNLGNPWNKHLVSIKVLK